MKFTYSINRGYVSFKFDGKPSEAVRTCLKGHGFRWNPNSLEWWRAKVSGAADAVAAVQKLLDRESGVRRPDGKCWKCQAEEGFFRPRGAACPVWCDKCHAEVLAQEVAEKSTFQGDEDIDLLYEDDCARRCGL